MFPQRGYYCRRIINDMREAAVRQHATGGVSGHTGLGNSYAAGPPRAVNSSVQIACYVNGQLITDPHDTTTMRDLSTDGYTTDAWLYTGTNGAAAPSKAFGYLACTSQRMTHPLTVVRWIKVADRGTGRDLRWRCRPGAGAQRAGALWTMPATSA